MNEQIPKTPQGRPEPRALLFQRVMTGILVFTLIFGTAFLSSALVRRNARVQRAAPSEDAAQTEPAETKPKTTKDTNAVTEQTEPLSTEAPNGKIIYLTFDDGPGAYTEQLLDILDRYDVKVTFFLTNVAPAYQDLIHREAQSGHAVGVHSYSHDYNKIYASADAYWEDFEQMRAVIKKQTGIETPLFRFPGGSSNTVSNFNPGIMTTLTKQANEKGLVYFDWNAMSGDAGATTDSAVVLQNCKDSVSQNERTVLLCHDTKEFTVNAMEEFIRWALSNGYTFSPLDKTSYAAHHAVKN